MSPLPLLVYVHVRCANSKKQACQTQWDPSMHTSVLYLIYRKFGSEIPPVHYLLKSNKLDLQPAQQGSSKQAVKCYCSITQELSISEKLLDLSVSSLIRQYRNRLQCLMWDVTTLWNCTILSSCHLSELPRAVLNRDIQMGSLGKRFTPWTGICILLWLLWLMRSRICHSHNLHAIANPLEWQTSTNKASFHSHVKDWRNSTFCPYVPHPIPWNWKLMISLQVL